MQTRMQTHSAFAFVFAYEHGVTVWGIARANATRVWRCRCEGEGEVDAQRTQLRTLRRSSSASSACVEGPSEGKVSVVIGVVRENAALSALSVEGGGEARRVLRVWV